MKLIISILLFCVHFSFAQENYFVVITEPQIGAETNANNLIEVVEDINKRQDISYVVVLGNITANGKFDEFIWAQEILDELTIPYSVVGGEKDYLLSEGKGTEISLLWGIDKNFIDGQSYSLVSVNTILPDFVGKKYIDVETISLINDKAYEMQSDRLISFSYYPINLAENNYYFFEPLLNKKIFSFVGEEDNTRKYQSTFEGLYLNRKDGWGYLLASTKKETIQITKILSDEIKKKVKPEVLKFDFTKPFLLESNKPVNFIKPGSVVWSSSMNKVACESSASNSDKIYTAFKNGLINCLNSDGTEQWHYETNKRINVSLQIVNDILVFASDDGDIITLNANTGSPNQIIGIGEKITSGISTIETNDAGFKLNAVVVGTQYGNLFCYDLLTLDPLWTQQLSGMDENLEIVSSIVSSNNKIFFCDNKGSLYCLSAQNGMLIWNISSSKIGWKSHSNILVINNNLYLVEKSGNLFCVDALLGEPKWDIKNIYANGIIKVNEKNEFILPTKKNNIIIISTKLGKVISEIECPLVNDESITDLILIEKNIIIGYSDGWVYKINMKQKVEKFFRIGSAPIVSLEDLNGNCLVTDYDGNVTLLNLSGK